MPTDSIQILIAYLKGDRSHSIFEIIEAGGKVLAWLAASLRGVFGAAPVHAFGAPPAGPGHTDLDTAVALEGVMAGAVPPGWLLTVLSLLLRRLVGG